MKAENPLNSIPSYQSLMKPVLIALKDGLEPKRTTGFDKRTTNGQ